MEERIDEYNSGPVVVGVDRLKSSLVGRPENRVPSDVNVASRPEGLAEGAQLMASPSVPTRSLSSGQS